MSAAELVPVEVYVGAALVRTVHRSPHCSGVFLSVNGRPEYHESSELGTLGLERVQLPAPEYSAENGEIVRRAASLKAL